MYTMLTCPRLRSLVALDLVNLFLLGGSVFGKGRVVAKLTTEAHHELAVHLCACHVGLWFFTSSVGVCQCVVYCMSICVC